jgi:hypothetical protein
MVVPNEDDPLEPRQVIVLPLQQHRNEGLNLEDLRALLHHEVVVLEPEVQKVVALERRVRARHGDDLGLLRHQVVGPVRGGLEQLERAALLFWMREDLVSAECSNRMRIPKERTGSKEEPLDWSGPPRR